METMTYKCLNCGGGLVFNPNTQRFQCEYCLSEFDEGQLKQMADPDKKENPEDMLLYICPSCGAEIVSDETTAASYCYYCHNPIVMSGKLVGMYRPDLVIPFEMDQKQAKEVFKQWIQKKRYVPKDFYSPKQMELLEGIYYPYLLYSCQVEAQIEAEGLKCRVYRSGSVEYTETSRYQVGRGATVNIQNITRNALKKADHHLAEAVLPFEMEKMKPFQTAYLSGFRAERRDMEREDFENEVEEEIRNFAVESLKNSIAGYDTVSVKRHEETILDKDWKYGLLPVWVLTYKNNRDQKMYYFAMNGQNGKVCGILPVDYKRLAGLFAEIFFPLCFLFLLVGYFL